MENLVGWSTHRRIESETDFERTGFFFENTVFNREAKRSSESAISGPDLYEISPVLFMVQ
jgi:hypothetical protein